MWALPNIKSLNEEAERNFKSKEKPIKKPECDYCNKKAVSIQDYYDVFGPYPKGKVCACKEHDDWIDEGYFICDDCEKLMIKNYTHEIYFKDTDNGRICLNCYFDQEIKKPSNWIKNVEDVTWERVKRSKHLIPVEGTHWESKLQFL